MLRRGLLDRVYFVRTSCAAALAQLARRFPEQVPQIEELLLRVLDEPEFEDRDTFDGRTGHDYAFEGLWLLVVGKQQEQQ